MSKRGAAVIAAALLLTSCGGQTTGDGAKTPAATGAGGAVQTENQGDGEEPAKSRKNCITKRAVVMC